MIVSTGIAMFERALHEQVTLQTAAHLNALGYPTDGLSDTEVRKLSRLTDTLVDAGIALTAAEQRYAAAATAITDFYANLG